MNDTIYTLRKPTNCGKDEIYPEQFATFKDAYKKLNELFNESINKNEEPVYWGIWETTISTWNGKTNSMTRACWH